MTKAERRKRARQRQKERERAVPVGAPESSTSMAATASSASSSPEPVAASAVEESPYITAPLVAPASRATARGEAPSRQAQELIDAPIDGEFDGEDADQDDEEDDDDDDEAPEGDEDEDDDGDFEDDLDDALFNAACGAVEQGEKYSWNELVGALCAAEVDDPRLGLLVGLLVEQDERGQPLPLTGERVLKVLSDLECDDLVEEAREVAEAGAEDETPEDRAVVRTNARELRAQAERELEGKPERRDARKPIKASQLRRPAQTALGQSIPVVGSGRRSAR
jgi:hypothetical protein